MNSKRTEVSIVLAAALVFASAPAAVAANRNWIGGSGHWNTGANWSGGTAPALNDSAHILPSDGVARTITFDGAPVLHDFVVDLTGPGANRTTFQMSSGNLVNNSFVIGYHGRATLNQSGGALVQSDPGRDAAVGWDAGGNGIYNLSGSGTLAIARDLYVGAVTTSAGEINQSGGTVSVGRDLLVAFQGGTTGTYNLTGGSLVVGRELKLSNGMFSIGKLTVSGAGTLLTGSLSLSTSGNLVELSGGTITTGTLNVMSQLSFSSGTLNVTGPGGLVVGQHIGNITLGPTQTLNVTSLLNIGTFSSVALQGGTLATVGIFRQGQFSFSSGTLEIAGLNGLTIGSNFTGAPFPGNLTLGPQQRLRVAHTTAIAPAASLTLNGGVLETAAIGTGGGQFQWTSGTLHVETFSGNLVNQAGALAPGRSAGSTTIIGNYTQQAGAELEIEIGGTATATQHDFVNVTGTALLGGELKLSLINGFVPTAQQVFTVFNAGSLLGFFSNAGNNQRLDTIDGLGSFLVNYGPTSPFNPNQIVLTAFELAADLPGDFNGNGAVENADLTLLLNNWGATVPPAPAGWIGSPLTAPAVDNDELTALLNNWGAVAGTGSSAAAVPEPASLALLAASLLGLAAARVPRRDVQESAGNFEGALACRA